jgi:NAD(P)-dependent dehydrogenase (short-subunit alcohol dehydrogenase family)
MGEPEDLSVRIQLCICLRYFTHRDLQGAIVFLASDASRFVTGSEIRVDGGYCVI